MGYLFDADALITPNNTWGSIEHFSPYWDLLVEANANGDALSLEKVYEEVTAGDDEVAEWAKVNRQFFNALDDESSEINKKVVEYVQSLPQPDTEKRKFLKGADPLLISYAIVHKHTVVTCETEVASNCKSVKVPNVCKHFGVRSINPMYVMRELRASFKFVSYEKPS